VDEFAAMGLDDCLDHVWERAEVYLDSKPGDKKCASDIVSQHECCLALKSMTSSLCGADSVCKHVLGVQEAVAALWQS
jgi:hypothetical protein